MWKFNLSGWNVSLAPKLAPKVKGYLASHTAVSRRKLPGLRGGGKKKPAEMAETKIIYHIDEEETPYLVKIPIAAENITLLDFKQVLNKPNYKFFFKSMDQDFGWVAEIFFSKIKLQNVNSGAHIFQIMWQK